MTQSKAYNLKLYCDIKQIPQDSEEAQEFLNKKFYEQLTIIKELRINKSEPEPEPEPEQETSSYLDYIIKK